MLSHAIHMVAVLCYQKIIDDGKFVYSLRKSFPSGLLRSNEVKCRACYDVEAKGKLDA